MLVCAFVCAFVSAFVCSFRGLFVRACVLSCVEISGDHPLKSAVMILYGNGNIWSFCLRSSCLLATSVVKSALLGVVCALSLARPAASDAWWRIDSGLSDCSITVNPAGQSFGITDGADSRGNNEACTVTALQPLYATATQYKVESCYDGIRHRAANPPTDVHLPMYTDASQTQQD